MLVDYKNYGKCAKFEKNGIIALVTLDLGPRIIYYGTDDLNFLNEDLNRNVCKSGEYFDKTFKPGEAWYLYGGHRVWKSPEDMECYVPDNYPIEYTLTECGGIFTSKAAKNFDYILEVQMCEDGKLKIKNSIKNKSDEDRRIAVWALTVAAKGGVLIVPLNDPADDLNPVQNLVQWPYNDLNDERVTFGKKHLSVKQTSKPEALKLGLFSHKNRAYYHLNGKLLKVEFVPQKGEYGDFWCNFETYTNCHIIEIEGLSPIKTLKGGECGALEEVWSISDFDGSDYTELN